ncbi:S8 family peptidase [Aminipila luticellarii]|uniref:Peptidase n=1 Tax=Aminipila luticellarii TaxID=2507160 RepID=A0A410PT93_9FIRM|nr:S8 family peptidase [Aminipila luticellarii]QAT42106.1 peptidase [Aminipila luticellarii]
MNEDALYSPDVVDFTIRTGSYYESYVLNHPGLITSYRVDDTYLICYTTLAAFGEIAGFIGVDARNSIPNIVGLTDQQSLETAGITQVQQQPYLNLNGQGVLLGFLDTGIDYTQPVFRYEDGTSKIIYLYDQTQPGAPPAGFPIGTEYTNDQINAALASDTPYDIVPQRDTVGHGTFLASIAAGRPVDDFIGAAPDSDIIMVKLRKAYPFYLEQYCVPPDQENAFASTDLMLGVQYILKRARELNRPVVLCLGLGSNYDSHDGYSIFEEYLFDISNIPGVCSCVSVGNESQSRHHFSYKMEALGTPANIDIRVGENAGDIYVAVANRVSDRVSLSVRSPSGELVNRVPSKAGYTFEASLVLERSRVTVSYYFPLEGSGDQLSIVRILDATPGVWTITVYGDIIIDGRINAWLPLTGFISPSVEFLTYDPYTTITYPATSLSSIRCGAYNGFRDSLFPRSSWGPTRLSAYVPDLVAPGYQVGGYYPTGYGTMDGTSVAAAITAGACALLMQWGIVEGNDLGLSTPAIRAYLVRGCTRSDVIQYPNLQWGYGVLNLMQTFVYMREI